MASAGRRRRLSRAEDNIRWIEEHCRVPQDKLVGQLVRLSEQQRGWLGHLYDSRTRLFILSMARKNGQTGLAAFLLLLHLCGPEARQERTALREQ